MPKTQCSKPNGIKCLFFGVLFIFFTCVNSFALQSIEKPSESSIFITIDSKNDIGSFTEKQLVPNQDFKTVRFNSASDFQALEFPCFVIFEIDPKAADFEKFADNLNARILDFLLSNKTKVKGLIFDFSPDLNAWQDNNFVKLYCLLAREIKKKYPNIPIGGAGFSYVFEGEAEGNFKEVSSGLKYYLDFIERVGLPCEILYLKSKSLIPYGYFLRNSFLRTKVFPSLKKQPLLYDLIDSNTGGSFINVSLLQCFICSVKGRADFIEFNRFNSFLLENLNKYPVQIDTEGLDRIAFLAMGAKSKDSKDFVFVFAGTSPSLWLLSDEKAAEKSCYEKEFRNYVHKYTDGLFPPFYNRFRVSLTNMPWEGKKIKMERFIVDSAEIFKLVEENVFDGMKDFYINKPIVQDGVVVIKFSEYNP